MIYSFPNGKPSNSIYYSKTHKEKFRFNDNSKYFYAK